jgi:hypothetical protein
MPNQTCIRCTHAWESEIETPVKCPKCKSVYWNKPRKYRLKSRPDAMPEVPRHPGRWIRTEPDKRHGISLDDALSVLNDCKTEFSVFRRELEAIEKIVREAFRT